MLDTMRSISDYIRKFAKRLKNKKTESLLVIILLFGLFLRLHFFVGLNWSDDVAYVGYADNLLEGNFYHNSYPNTMRLGFIYPITFFFWIFGVSNISAALFPILTSLGSIILIFYIGKIFLDTKTSLISAFLLSIFPLNVGNSTWIMPDIPLAFFTSLSIFLFFYSERKRNSFYYLLTGIFIGISYLIKVSGLIPLIFIVPYIFYKTFKKRNFNLNYFLVFLGFLIIFSLESLYYLLNTGNFLFRYKAVSNYFSGENLKEHALVTDLSFYPKVMFNLNYNYIFDFKNKFNVYYGIFYYLLIPSIFYLVYKTKKKSYKFIIWFSIFFLYLQFGTMSLRNYTPIHRLYRHLSLITIPFLLFLGYFLRINYESTSKKRLITIFVIILLTITSFYYIDKRTMYLRDSVEDQKEIYKFLKNKDQKNVYTSGGSVGHLNFYSKFKWKNKLRGVGKYTDCNDLKDSYVVVDATRGWIENYQFLRNIPECIKEPPENWRLVKIIKGSNLGVYNRFNPKIYYVPQT